MRSPQKEVERLSKNPVRAKQGVLSAIQSSQRQSIHLDLNSFPEQPEGSLFRFSSEEWVRVLAIIRVYLARGKKNSKKKERR